MTTIASKPAWVDLDSSSAEASRSFCLEIYLTVEDVDAAYRKALDLGARAMLSPQRFPGGRFAIVSDPGGASFGLLKMTPR